MNNVSDFEMIHLIFEFLIINMILPVYMVMHIFPLYAYMYQINTKYCLHGHTF